MALGRNAKIGIAAVVVAAVAIAFYLNTQSGPNLSGSINARVNATQMSDLQAIALNNSLAGAVGQGVATMPKAIGGASLLKIGGKPGVLYVGADYCPFCAALRWGLVIALMRFGSFSSLHYMTSSTSPEEPYPGTATFTFYNSTYSSGTIGFAAVELQNITHAPLQSMNDSQTVTFNQYNYAQGAIPFLDIGNVSVQSGADFSPQLVTQKDWGQIISQLSNPSDPAAQGVIGSANIFTAQICKATNMTPASICGQPYITKILS